MWLKLPETPHQNAERESACASQLSVSASPNPAADPSRSQVFPFTRHSSRSTVFIAVQCHIHKIHQTLMEKPQPRCRGHVSQTLGCHWLVAPRKPMNGIPRCFRCQVFRGSASCTTWCRPLTAARNTAASAYRNAGYPNTGIRGSYGVQNHEAQEETPGTQGTTADCFQFPSERQGSIERSG